MAETTLILDPAELGFALLCVALCRHCASQRAADPAGPELETLPACIVSGCCHDCGGGFCLCRGVLECPRCPRRNAPVLLSSLTCYRVVVPPAPPTVPSLIGKGRASMMKRTLVCDGCGKEDACVGGYSVTLEKRQRRRALRVGPRKVDYRRRRRFAPPFMAEMDFCDTCAARPIDLLAVAVAVEKKQRLELEDR